MHRPEAPGDAFAALCDLTGVVRQLLIEHGEPIDELRVGGDLRELIDADSLAKMSNFLAVALDSGPTVGWEMNLPLSHGMRTMTFAAVRSETGIIVAAAVDSARLAQLLEKLVTTLPPAAKECVPLLREATGALHRMAGSEAGLFDELSHLNNELATLQKDLAQRNRELGAQRIRLWNILSVIKDAVLAVDENGKVTFANRAAELLTGLRYGQQSPVPLSEALRLLPSTKAPSQLLDFHAAWRNGLELVVEDVTLQRTDGGSVLVTCFATPLQNGEGKAEGAVILVRDMSAIQRARDVAIESERLTTAQGIAIGIAHTVNNVLAVISGSAEILMKDVSTDQRNHVTTILNGVRRVADLTSGLLSATESAVSIPNAVEVSEVIRAAIVEVGARFSSVKLTDEGDSRPLRTTGSSTQLTVALVNIITNACEAAGASGEVRVKTRGEADAIRIEVSDTGPGMSDDVKARIFTPFYTTKFLGRGFGLASARAIMRAHGGEISVDSTEGKGTTVVMLLPRRDRD